jgi:putative hydrolase of the HAD superfamily
VTTSPNATRIPAQPTGGIDTVIVDYGGVLTNPLAETLGVLAQNLQLPPQLLAGAFAQSAARHGISPMADLETGKITEAEFVARLLPLLPAQALPKVAGRSFGQVWFAGRRPNAEFVDYLRTLRAAGYRLVLLTNNVREWDALWRATIPVDELFALVVNSAEEGVRKPDPEIYARALTRLEARPERCLFVDDVAENCQTAADMGMATIQFQSTEQAVAAIDRRLGRATAAGGGAG